MTNDEGSTMILFYSPGACSLAAMVLLQRLGAPHRLCRLTRDERKGPVYRGAINEHGQVPALLEDGGVLTENAAILLLCADRHADAGMAPAPNTRERYAMYRWLSWLDSGFHMAHAPMFAPQRFTPDESHHDAVRAHAMIAIRQQLGVLDRHLDGREHVLLDRANLLDPYVFAMARWCESKMDYDADFPHVARFLRRMREDQAVQTGLSIEAGDIQVHGALTGHVALSDLVGADGHLTPDS